MPKGIPGRALCSTDGCDRISHARSLCTKHYQRLKKTGTTERHIPTATERFWSHVDASGDCWLWTAAKAFHEYGSFNAGDGEMVLTHRYSWEMRHGPIPAGLWVLHHCDNPPCVRPEHLYVGDAKDNSRDCVVRNRTARGERHKGSKLTDEGVREIRWRVDAGERRAALADEFGVAKSNVDQIVWRTTWRHVV